MSASTIATHEESVETSVGPGRLYVWSPEKPKAYLLLGHGAGGGVDSFDLAALAAHLPQEGIAVGLFEQPWRTAGKKIAGPTKQLDAAWRAVLEQVTASLPKGTPLVVGGRSAGARAALRGFASPARGVVALSFPLHPPGKPEKSRAKELTSVKAPVLVVQGSRDPFGTPAELAPVVAQDDRHVAVVIDGATHSFSPTSQDDDGRDRAVSIAHAVGEFVRTITR